MRDPDQLLARVRKLLAQAEDAGVTEAEAEVFNTKAAELIARYGIDRAMLAADCQSKDEITSVSIPVDSPYSTEKAHLLHWVADPLRCRTVLHGFRRTISKVTVLGYASDLERVQLLYTSLLLQATTQLAQVRPDQVLSYFGESVAAYRRTWLSGFAAAVKQWLEAAEARALRDDSGATGGGQSTALVIHDRQARVDIAYEEAFPNLRKARRRKLSGGGFADGHNAGLSANLHGKGVGHTRRTLAG